MTLTDNISKHITQTTGKPFKARKQRSVGGGCINQAYVIEDGQSAFFVKTNQADKQDMFKAEAAGLNAILASQSLRAPRPICFGETNDQAYLVLEYIALQAGDSSSAQDMGLQLAQMHRKTASQFGWGIDNTIGATPQINTRDTDWVRFYGQHRLHYQISLAQNNGLNVRSLGEELIDILPAFFDTYKPPASLLHGDLWGGNWGTDQHCKAVIFDPAVYYGDRESDLAMTELFGGFPARFYDAYKDIYPIDTSGYAVRKTLYQLYHVLNHFNLFGGAYADQAQHMIQRLLAEVRG